MKLQKIKEERKNNRFSFLLKDSDEVFANTVRRLIIEEVPTLAIEDMEIRDNSSALYDEMLGLRLGLTPIKTDLKSYELKEKCKCQGVGCARCELKIELKAGKKDYVYASDAKSSDPKCTFVHPRMPLVKLLAKQKLDLTMTAVLGKGKDHTKWSPGWAFYRKEPVISLGKVADPEGVAKRSPDGVFVFKNNKLSVDPEKVYESNLLEYYPTLDKEIKVEFTDNFIFNLESWGQLSCKEILNQSAEILIEKVEELEKQA